MPVVLLGVLKAGAAFHCLDINMLSSVERLMYVIRRLDIECFVIHTDLVHLMEPVFQFLGVDLGASQTVLDSLGLTILQLVRPAVWNNVEILGTLSFKRSENLKSELADTILHGSEFSKETDIHEKDIAYVITTSGTTGLPKIVQVPHQCIVPNITHISAIYNLSPADLVFQASPLTFDPCIVEIFSCFYAGATLLCTMDIVKLQPRVLVDCVARRNRVTVMQVTPSMLSHMCIIEPDLILGTTSSLRILSLGGESCPRGSTVRKWKAADNHTTIINLYGITEVSSWATWHELTDKDLQSDEDVPLGLPLDGTLLELHDIDPTTNTGALWIGGKSRVCLIDDETCLTPGKFRSTGDLVRKQDVQVLDGDVEKEEGGCDVESGRNEDDTLNSCLKIGLCQLIYVGREDDVVKRHGKRINLLEISNVAVKSEHVHAATAINNNNKLLLFIEPSKTVNRIGDEQISDDVRSALHQWLPDYYQPDETILIAHMPITKHGKVDKRRLLDVYENSSVVNKEITMQTGFTANEVYKMILELCLMHVAKSTQKALAIESTVAQEWMQHTWIEIGGNSLTAIQLANDIQSHTYAWTGQDVDLGLLLDQLLHKPLCDVILYVHENATNTAGFKSENDFYSGSPTENHSVGDFTVDEFPLKTQSEDLKLSNNLGSDAVRSDSTPESDVNVVHDHVQHDRVNSPVKRGKHNADSQVKHIKLDIGSQGYDNAVASDRLSLKRHPNSSTIATNKKINLQEIRKAKVMILDDSESCAIEENSRSESSGLIFSAAVEDIGIKRCNDIVDDFLDDADVIQEDNMLDDADVLFSVSRCSRVVVYQTSRDTIKSALDIELPAKESRLSCPYSDHRVTTKLDFKFCWSYDTGKCVDSSPLVTIQRNSSGVVYIGSHSHRFVAIDLGTGRCIWKTELPDRIEASACVSGCTSFICIGCYDGCIYVLDRLTGQQQWSHQTKSQVKSSPCLTNHRLICVGSHDQRVHLLDLQKRSCKEIDLHGGSIFSSPCYDSTSHQVLIGSLGGRLTAIDSTSSDIIWTSNIGKPLFSSVLATRAGFCVGSVDNCVYFYNRSGVEVWKYATEGPVFSSPCLALIIPTDQSAISSDSFMQPIETIVVGSHDSNVYCLATIDGSLIWKTKLNSSIYSSPFSFSRGSRKHICNISDSDRAISESAHIISDSDRIIYDSDCTIGNKYQRFDVVPLLSEGTDYVITCSTSGTVYILSMLTGAILSQYTLPGEVFSSPVIVSDRLVVGCRDNNVYCLQICYKSNPL